MIRHLHTPGPWKSEGPIVPDTFSVVAGGEQPSAWIFIAKVHADGVGGGPDREEGKANVLLISAAPELADALEALLGDATDSYCEYCDRHAAKNASGQIVSNVPHAEDCPAVAARAALRKAGRIE